MEMFSPDEDDVVSITDEERGTDTGGRAYREKAVCEFERKL